MAPTIHLVRHAQGVHNLSVENESIHDPDLTTLGEQQCADLRAAFKDHSKVTKLVASPLRRTINTCDLAFGGDKKKYPIITLDSLQEVSDQPCDTGSSKDKINAEFGSKVDLSRVRDDWTVKGAGSPFEPTLSALTARAKVARRELKELAGDGDDQMVVVTHGGFLHFLTDDWEGIPEGRATAWSNCMCRSYRFVDAEDGDVRLVETEDSWRNRQPVRQPLSLLQRNELRSSMQQQIAPYLKIKA